MRTLLLFVLCWMGSAAQAAALDVRANVRAVAAVIESRYFDVEQGRALARELTERAEQGHYDAFSNAQALAMRLTQELRRVDRHLSVVAGQALPQRRRMRPARVSQGVEHGFGRIARLDGNVGYVELVEAAHFEFDDPDSPVRAKADQVLAQLRDADAVILDLRSNPGGSPAMVGYLVSAFVPSDRDVYNRFHTREGVFTERPATPYPTPRSDVPLFVLVGPGTASAAESLAYTLQACGRATIVGEPTAGAANPGELFPATAGISVFVPTGSPRNPLTQRNWEGEGVQPDIVVASADALAKAHALARGE
jgi:C-terminal processing protease CtpA/Prc